MEEDYVMIPGSGTKMIIGDVKKEIETAFLDYSMSVIVARALPDVRDGLKPVHRRILYSMYKIAGVKLHAHAVRRKIHGNAALLTQCLCRKPHHAVSGIQHIVVVITARIG